MNPIQSELHAEIQPDPPTPSFPSKGLVGRKARDRAHASPVDTATLTIRECELADLRAHPDLIAAHWAEVMGHVRGVELDVAWSALEQMPLRVVGLFDGDKLVGYGLGYVTASLHSRRSLTFQVDAIYVEPAYRIAGVARRLLAQIVPPDWPGAVVAHAKVGSAAEAFLVRQGFGEMVRIFIHPGKE